MLMLGKKPLAYSAILVLHLLSCAAAYAQPSKGGVTEKYRFDRVPGFLGGGGNIAFSPDGKTLAARDKEALLAWDIASGNRLLRIESKLPIGGVSFPNGSSEIAYVGHGVMEFFHIEKGSVRRAVYTGDRFVGFSPKGTSYVVLNKGVVEIRDTEKCTLIRSFRVWRNELGISAHRLGRDGNALALAHVDKKITLWDISSGELQQTLKGHQARVAGLSFHPDGKSLVAAVADKTIIVWATGSGEVTMEISLPDNVISVRHSPDGRFLAIGSVAASNRISIRETVKFKELVSWNAEPDNSRTLAFNPQGTLLAATGGRSFQVFELPKLDEK